MQENINLGKAKKRIIYRGKNEQFSSMTRAEAVQNTAKMLNDGDKKAYSLITLFGLSAEEVLEAGASYETVKGMENLFK